MIASHGVSLYWQWAHLVEQSCHHVSQWKTGYLSRDDLFGS